MGSEEQERQRQVVGIVGDVPQWLAREAQPEIYGVKPQDPLTLVCAVVVLTVVACAAIVQPARRAMRIDPARALWAS